LIVSGFVCVSIAQTVDDDILLLELVAQQSRDLHMDTLWIGDSAIVVCDTVWKCYPHPLCVPLMYVPQSFPSLGEKTQEIPSYSIASIRRNALRYILANNADLYVSISDPIRLKKVDIGKTKVHRTTIKHVERNIDANRALHNNISPWRKGAQLSLQITQNYATDNWHQGSVNAFSMLGNAKAFVNYKGKYLSWENSAEWRVGVSTISGDSLRVMNTTDDRFQIYSKFGYQVHKKWYVSTFADFKTNLFPNFQKNSNKLNTTFLTPIRYTMGIGVDYKPIKGLNVNISPATYKMVYANIIDPEYVNVTDFGLETNQHILNEIGSSLRLEWKWKPIREIELETRFYFFTNYKQIEVDLEIDVDFIINRYMSAQLIVYPRYDGTIENVTNRISQIQFKELISVGFAHTFR
jgi:hypothetical protein